MIKRKPKKCEYCGKFYSKKPKDTHKYFTEKKYCNRDCYTKAQKGKIRLSTRKRKDFICKFCGKVTKNVVKSIAEKRQYCSQECSTKAHKGKNHPNFKGGRDIENIRKIKAKYRKSAKGKISEAKYRASEKRKVVVINSSSKRRSLLKNCGNFTTEEWEYLKKKYNYTCPDCGKKEPKIKLTVDHFHPLTKGGTNYIDNIRPACGKCNSKKSNKIIPISNAFGKPSFLPAYRYSAKCKRVIDGDTIICEWVDIGFHILFTDLRFRFNRINCPETRTKDLEEKKKGLAAKEWLKEKIQGKKIVIETHKNHQQDAFGRYLVEVWFDSININDELVSLGFALYKIY